MKNILQLKPIIYITRDIERALGFDLSNPNYYIISNSNDFAKQIAKNRSNIILIENQETLDTWELLQNDKTKNFVNKLKNPHILVFKPTTQIEKICAENNWKLLNPSSTLANKVEQKISSVNWLEEDSKYFPDVKIDICENIEFHNKKFILQFNQSHTGSGTMLIESKKQLDEIKNKFPKRDCKISRFVEGILLTNNNVVTDKKTMLGNINYQITGLEPFTKNKFTTIGNDWGLAHKLLNDDLTKQYQEIVEAIGKRLRKENWRGLFGVDIIWETKTNKLYLIEINARQPASTTFESQLQMQNKKSENDITTFEAHLLALLGENLENKNIIKITDGSQIILRKSQENIDVENIKSKLEKENFNVIQYDNDKENSDLLRIQSQHSIMEAHDKFNSNGQKIIKSIGQIRKSVLSEYPNPSTMLQNTIKHYLNLNIAGKSIQTPYFNNRRNAIRGALAVLIGKGNPQDIEDEAQIISLKEKLDLTNLPAEKIKEFLVNNNLGVDCSGFVYHILDALAQEKKNKKLKQIIHFPLAKSVVRKMIAKLRPAENCGVTTLAHEINSKKINLKDVEANDFIIFLGSGPKQDYNHIMFIESVTDKTINYIHAYKWPSDGQYNHGVRRGKIEIIDDNKNILEQKWLEQEKTGENNWTWLQANNAKEIFVGRLKNL